MLKIKIQNKYVSEEEKVFLVAEAGVNHNGKIQLAKKLVDAAADAGVDAVKFQTFKAEKLLVRGTKKAQYQKRNTDKSEDQYEMIKKFELSEDEFLELHDYTLNQGLIFLSTPYDFGSADFLNPIVPAFKISSSDLTNLPFLDYIAKKNKPVILSTGMGTLGEIEEAVNTILPINKNLIILHCITDYPASFDSLNLRAIQTLKEAFKLLVGFSDHSPGVYAPISAVSLGAVFIEKHFTLDKNLPGPDHKASLNPKELKELVKAVRLIESALGNGVKKPTSSEEKIKRLVRRSLVANVDIPKGTKITKDMIAIKRPGTGIPPKYLYDVIGKTSKQDIKKDEILKWQRIL